MTGHAHPVRLARLARRRCCGSLHGGADRRPGGRAGHHRSPRAAATPKAMVQTRLSPPGLLPMARRSPAPGLEVTAFDGRTVSLQRLRGRPAVVSFFESWCGTCQAEQPDLTKVAADFAGRVGFVGVSYHDTVAAALTYLLGE